MAFSNSVIEHLFTYEAQSRMAAELQRVAPRDWVQTPNFWFPIEPHFLVPAWHWLPEDARVAMLTRRGVGWAGRCPDPAFAREIVQQHRLMRRRRAPAAVPRSGSSRALRRPREVLDRGPGFPEPAGSPAASRKSHSLLWYRASRAGLRIQATRRSRMATAEKVLKPDFETRRKHFIFTEEHDQLRESIRAFVKKELAPHSAEWEETTFPDSVFRRMGELGFLGLSYPEEYGGQGGDYYCNLVLAEEIVARELRRPRHGRGGAHRHGHAAGAPVRHRGAEAALPRARRSSGQKISCLGITEPDAGSDVAGIKTRAVRDGDEWVINGSKTYITNGHRADFIVLVTKTDADAGYDGFSLFLVDMDTPTA